MYRLIIFIAFSVCFFRAFAQQIDTFIDERDGQQYEAVMLGDQWWMAENLKYEPAAGSWCYDDSQANCDDCGLLYTYDVAKEACPSGWHLPTDEEWKKIDLFVGVSDAQLDYLGQRDAPSTAAQFLSVGGESGFNVKRCGGRRLDENQYELKEYAPFMSASEIDMETFWLRDLYPINTNTYVRDWGKKWMWALSVRCVADEGSFFVEHLMPDQGVELEASVNLTLPDSMFYNEADGELTLSVFGVEDIGLYYETDPIENHIPLPDGLTFDPTDNSIKGELLEAGIYPIKIIAENSNGDITSDIFSISDQVTLVIGKIKDNQISVFPNPMKRSFHIDIEGLSNKRVFFEINDSSGRTIKRGITTGNSINVQGMNSGLYFLIIDVNGQVITKKIFIR